jgi:hypothetical protein
MILYRVVKGDHAANRISEDRCHDGVGPALELSHSPEMAKRYARLAEEDHVLSSCAEVRVRHSFISGWIGRGLSTNQSAECRRHRQHTRRDRTRTMTLKKTDKNVRTTICDGFFSGAANTTRKIVIASLRPQRYLLIDEV